MAVMQKPFTARARVEEKKDSILIHIPVRKNWFALLFMPLWFLGWVFGGISILQPLFANGLELTQSFPYVKPSQVFLIVWLIGWILTNGFIIYTWLQMALGVEIIEFLPASVSIGEKILVFDRGRSYAQSYITRLKITEVGPSTWFENRFVFVGGAPCLSFDYGSRTIRFGKGIDEAEGIQILNLISQRLPQYRQVSTIASS